jgi:hypothetical protein
MSIMSCPIPDPNYRTLVSELGEYQANLVAEAKARVGEPIPSGAELNKLITFWKDTRGYQAETAQQAKSRILRKFGKRGTKSLVQSGFYAQMTKAVTDFNKMKGERQLGYFNTNKGGTAQIYVVRSDGFESEQDFAPDVMNEAASDPDVTRVRLTAENENLTDKFKVLIDTYHNKKRDVARQLVELRQKRKEVSDPLAKATISKKAEELEQQIDEINNDIKALKAERAVEGLVPYFRQDADMLFRFLNKETIENPDLVDFKQMELARKILNTWLSISNVANENHPFLDSFELEDENVINILNGIFNEAAVLNKNLGEIALKKVTRETSTYLEKQLSSKVLIEARADANIIAANVLNLQRTDPTLLQAIAMKIKDTEFISFREYAKTEEKFSKLLNNAMPILRQMNPNSPFEIFKQTDKDGLQTGDMVYRYSQDFYDVQSRMYKAAREETDADKKSDRFKKLFKWQSKNVRYLDPSKLSDPSYIAEIRRDYGDRGVDKLLERVQKKQEEFEQDYEAMKILYEKDYEGAEIDERLDEFDKKYNPKYFLENTTSGEKTIHKVNGKPVYPQTKYVVSIPRRIDTDGKRTEHYDSKYDTIAQNDSLFELHDMMMDMLGEYKRYIPYDLSGDLQVNSIPNLSRTLTELYGEEGLTEAGKGLYDQFVNSNLTTRTSDITYQAIDPLTHSIDPSLAFKMRFDTKQEIKLRTKRELNKMIANGVVLTDEIRDRTYREVRDTMSKEKSWDLGKLMKVYSHAAIQYKHKARVEDLLMWQKRIFEKTQEVDTKFGKQLFSADGKPIKEKADHLVNYKKTLDHTMNAFLGMPIRDIEGKTKKQVYDSKDLARKKDLEDQLVALEGRLSSEEITQKDYDSIKNDIQKELEQLGGDFTFSKFGDNVLQYFQLKGMGWNVFAGFTNVGFGLISNMLVAADGREFSEKNFWQSMRIALGSISNNYSFDQTKNFKNKTLMDAKKLRSLMDKNNVLKEASQEMFKRTMGNEVTGELTKRFKFLNPYNPQMRSEYLVQSMLLSAMMKSDKNKVVNLKGEEVALWEAFDTEGNWNYDEFGIQPDWEYDGKKMLNFLRRLESIIAEAHGDYANPLRIKKSILGRGLAQFRTWMFEGFANRFENETYDEVRGYERKGRYRSFDVGGGTVAGALAGTAIAPIIGTAVGAGIGYAAGKFFGTNNQSMSDVQSILFNIKQLFRRMLIGQSVFGQDLSQQYSEDTGFSEVDAANMRKNMSELAIYIYLYSFGMMMKAGLDDSEEKAKLALNFLINQGNRLETDILFYSNPMELRTLFKQLIPALSLVDDATKWFDAVHRQFDGNPNMMSGPFEGENILVRRSLENIPLGTQYYKIRKNMLYVMGD